MSTEPLLSQNERPDGLTTFKKWVFGTGHLMNDLCGATWFNYLLYFLVKVQGVSRITAGTVMLVGQVADALATPLVGLLSDRWNSPIGKRIPWYIGGSILVPIAFFFMF